MTEKVKFWQGGWSSHSGEAGFFRDGSPGWMPATALVGKVVNLGTKNGLVYDGVTVAGYTPDGMLTVRGGLAV